MEDQGGGLSSHVRDRVVLRTTQPFALTRTIQPFTGAMTTQPFGIGQPNLLHAGTAVIFTCTDSRIINQTFSPSVEGIITRT